MKGQNQITVLLGEGLFCGWEAGLRFSSGFTGAYICLSRCSSCLPCKTYCLLLDILEKTIENHIHWWRYCWSTKHPAVILCHANTESVRLQTLPSSCFLGSPQVYLNVHKTRDRCLLFLQQDPCNVASSLHWHVQLQVLSCPQRSKPSGPFCDPGCLPSIQQCRSILQQTFWPNVFLLPKGMKSRISGYLVDRVRSEY